MILNSISMINNDFAGYSHYDDFAGRINPHG